MRRFPPDGPRPPVSPIQEAFRFTGARQQEGLEKDHRARAAGAFGSDPRATKQGSGRRRKLMLKLMKRLQKPVALVGQGFVLGGILFFATHAESLLASPAPAQPSASLVASIAPAR